MNASGARPSPLAAVISEAGLTQRAVAQGVGVTEGFISKLVRSETTASQPIINALLVFLTKQLGRRVTYEECFGEPSRGAA